MDIVYKTDTVPSTKTIVDFFNHSGYYPIDDKQDTERIKNMFSRANLLVTAWHSSLLVGIARSLSDFCYCTYLSDLAVRDEFKGKGIGRKLVEITKKVSGNGCKLILQSSSSSVGFYTSIGMEPIASAFIIQRTY